MSIVLQSSGGGQITLQEPATASNFTQTLPAATGDVMVSGNMPAFSAYNSADQSLSNTSWNKVLFNTEEFDTNSNFASSRFTPTIAGYYQVNGAIFTAPGTVAEVILSFYKNGSEYKRGFGGVVTSIKSIQTSCLIYCNGSTDYIELYFYNGGAGVTLTGGSAFNWFNGSLVRSA